MSKGKAGNAKAALRALGFYGDDILDAFLRDNGRIEDSVEHETLIGALKKHRIVWRLDDSESYQLRNVVTRLLDHITEGHRRHSAHENIAGQWEYLQRQFEAYEYTIKNSEFEDRQRLEQEIPERILELIEDIRLAATSFNQYITSNFAYINNLELRIRENDRVLSRAHDLNVLFGSFSITEMAHLSIGEPFLEKLLLKHLPAALEKSRKDLSHTLDQLRKLLTRLRSEQRMVKLIGTFESTYLNNPGFSPSIDDIDFSCCPVAVNSTESFITGSYADVTDPDHETSLAELTNGIRKIQSDDNLEASVNRVPIDISRDPEQWVMEPDEARKAIETLIVMVREEGVTISASHSRDVLRVDIDLPSWLQMIVTDISALLPRQRAQISLEHKGVQHPVYQDNMLVNDIILRPTDAS